uniref:Uncharacterized protein n=1 Tax=Globisporangium ultimum (strain ATCC 200006 / CBS 805.95 / DAOM BR144) TaxID=431595 RepID=K3WJ98_GLOUD
MRHRHAIEEMAVVEYIEAIIPFVYAICLAIMVYLPNAKYNEDLNNITEQQTNTILVSTVIYTALEVLSLVHDIK